MSKTKKIISLLLAVMLVMTMATVAIVTTSAATKVYFEDSLNWGNIHAYCYGGDGELLGGWGGTACTDEGNGVWSIELSGTPDFIIFHANDDANQTSNIPFADGMIAKLTGEWIQGDYKMVAVAEFVAYEEAPVATGDEATKDEPVATQPAETQPATPGETVTVYFTNNWAFTTQNVYWWKGETNCGEWPGVAMTFVETNDGGENIYSAEVPADAEGIIFNGEHDQQPGTIRQTVDITEFANNSGFYCESENAEGKIEVGTYEYAGSIAPEDTTPEDTTPEDTTPEDTTPEDTTPEDTTPEDTTPEDTTPEVTETGVEMNGELYAVTVGDTITYTVKVTADQLFENVQAVVTYDADKLELVRKGDDEVYEEEIACPGLGDAIFNADVPGTVKFNASKVKGYDFKEGDILVTLDFIVKDNAKSTISIVIEEMTIKGDGTQSYFTGGQAVITDGITVEQTLDVPVPDTTPEDTTPEDTTPEDTTPEDTTPEDTTPEETKPANTDETSKTDATATDDNGTVGTGATAYIYIALAIMAMAAAAVVVLRKKANG